MHSFRHPGTVLTDHVFTVPLDHGDPAGPQIEVFAREVVAAAKTGIQNFGFVPLSTCGAAS